MSVFGGTEKCIIFFIREFTFLFVIASKFIPENISIITLTLKLCYYHHFVPLYLIQQIFISNPYLLYYKFSFFFYIYSTLTLIKTNFNRTTWLNLAKKKEQIKNIFRLENSKQKIETTTIYLSFLTLLTKEWPEHHQNLFYEIIGCSMGVYNFILLKSSIIIFHITNEPSVYEMSQFFK